MRKIFLLSLFASLAVMCLAQKKVKLYEYWFDEGFSAKKSIPTTLSTSYTLSTQIATAELLSGLHSFQLRFQDEAGVWSSPVTSFFIKPPQGLTSYGQSISGYEYWFDNNEASKTIVPVTASATFTVSRLIGTDQLLAGLHTFQIRFKDPSGNWSSPVTSFFIKPPQSLTASSQSISGYEYWFDNNEASKTIVPVTVSGTVTVSKLIGADQLLAGLHTFQIRFKDLEGRWSSTSSQFFIKPGTLGGINANKITAYRYWSGNEFNKHVTLAVDPINPFTIQNLLIPVVATQRVSPNHYEINPDPVNGLKLICFSPTFFHIQFKDMAGQWSTATVDTVGYRYSLDANCDTLYSNIPKVKALPKADTLHIYRVNALIGDSITFKTSNPLAIDLFDSYGKKLKTILPTQSVVGNGVRAKLDGAYYAIVHGFGISTGIYTITYNHIAKYAVLGYNLKKVGNKGISSMIFEGNGFTSATKIRLIPKAGAALIPITIQCDDLSLLKANINFDNAPLGIYSIEVDFWDKTIVIPNGLEVETSKPIELGISIIGSTVFRSGVPTTYTISIENKGNRTAYFVPLDVAFDYSTENSIQTLAIDNEIQRDKLSAVFANSDFVDTEIMEIFKEYDNSFTDLRHFSELKDQNTHIYSLQGQFFIPEIEANSTKQIAITVKAKENIKLNASIPKNWDLEQMYNDNQKTIKGNGSQNGEDLISKLNCAIDLLECLADILTPFENPDPACIKKAVNDLYNPNKEANLRSALGVVRSINEGISSGMPFSSFVEKISSDYLVSSVSGVAEAILTCWIQKGIQKFLLKSILQRNIVLKAYTVAKSCIPALNNAIFGNCFGIKAEISFSANLVRSYDPNDKIGYRSPSGSPYFNADKKNFTYVVNFENMASATAPAQEVVVTDTLNAKYFDINSFKAGYIKISNKIVQAPFDVQNNKWIVDMRPALNLRTEVQLTYDRTKGIARWYFKAVDPQTETLPTDPLSGFLPPNDSVGSGQGSVSFNIDLKDNLSDESEIQNRASIVFDYNDAILTPSFKNKKDIISPQSLFTNSCVASDSIITLQWQGSDKGSGVVSYSVYAKKNSDAYFPILLNSSLTTTSFTGNRGNNYSFYVLAKDSAENFEVKSTLPDVTITLPAKAEITGASKVCNGQSDVIYSVPVNPNYKSYIWTLPPNATGSSTTNSIKVTFGSNSVSGNIKVKGHNDCRDGTESTLAITVNTVPVGAGFISGPTTICQGPSPINYTVPEIASATSYVWSLPSNAVGSSTTNNVSVTFGVNSTSGNVTVRGHNECGDGIVSSRPITVSPVPPFPVISYLRPLTFFELDSTILVSSATIGNQWYKDGNILNGITSKNITVKTLGSYMVMVSNGTCSNQSSAVTVTAKLDLNPPVSSVLALPAIVYTDSVLVKWNGTDAETGIKDYSIFVSTDGTTFTLWLGNTTKTEAYFKGTLGNAYSFYCKARDKKGNLESKTVTEAQTWLALNVNIAKKWDDVLVCNNSAKLFTSYQWYKNDQPISGANKQFYQEIGGLNGSYYLIATTADGKRGLSNVARLVVSAKSINVFPNPTGNRQEFNVTINALETEMEHAKLSITSLTGQVIVQRNVVQQQMKLSNLPTGIYIVQVVFSNGESLTKKLEVKY